MLADLYRRHLAKVAATREEAIAPPSSDAIIANDEEEYGARLTRFGDRQARVAADSIRDGLKELRKDETGEVDDNRKRAHFLNSLSYNHGTIASIPCVFDATRMEEMRSMNDMYGGCYHEVVARLERICHSLQ